MRTIGITGGVGSGKSKVLEYLKEKEHTVVYQADLIARELQMPGNVCYEDIVQYFGEDILLPTGEINRRVLAERVFHDEDELHRLNELVHPAVNERIKELIQMEEQMGTERFVLEAALLTEPFYRTILDEIWYVYAKESVRVERLKQSRNYTEEKIASMMCAQPKEEEFRACSDSVIDNSMDFENTIKQIDILLDEDKI